MLSKIIVIIILFGIVGGLGSALFYLVGDKGGSHRMLRALTVRISLSVGLFLLLMLLWALGVIQPHGITPSA